MGSRSWQTKETVVTLRTAQFGANLSHTLAASLASLVTQNTNVGTGQVLPQMRREEATGKKDSQREEMAPGKLPAGVTRSWFRRITCARGVCGSHVQTDLYERVTYTVKQDACHGYGLARVPQTRMLKP